MTEETRLLGKDVLLGGQAVLEGVMMKGPTRIATAVRRLDRSVEVKVVSFTPLSSRMKVARIPVVRGAIGLVEMMSIGIQSLNYSAEVALHAPDALGSDQEHPRGEKSTHEALQVGVTVAISLAAAILIFFLAPLFVTSWLFPMQQSPLAFNVVAGSIRLGLFLGYLRLISWLPEIRRLFMYHGAEHKVVALYEAERELSSSGAERYSRFHPRCGTSFLLVVMIGSIVLYSLLDTMLAGWLGVLTLPVRLPAHLCALPLVAGVSYELIRFAATHRNNIIARWLIAPGLWLQRLTTREPEADQLEVAVIALRAALGGGSSSTMGEPALVQNCVISS